MSKKKKQGKVKEKNRLRIRHLWPRMTEAERLTACEQTMPNRTLHMPMWSCAWADVPQWCQSELGKLILPRREALRIAER